MMAETFNKVEVMSDKEKFIESFGDFELWEEFEVEEINDTDYPLIETETNWGETNTPASATEQVA